MTVAGYLFRGVKLVCVGASLLLLATTTTGCKQDVQLTRPAPVGPPPPAPPRRDVTSIGLGLSIDLKTATEIADKAIPENLGRIVEWFDDIACAKRTRWVECNGAKAEIDVVRNGPVTLGAEDGRIALRVPLKYTLAARGLGWASTIRDNRDGEIVATIPIDAGVGANFEPEVRLKEPVTTSEKAIPFLTKGKLSLAKGLESRLKKPLTPVADAIRDSIRSRDLRQVTERAWRALHTPIELSREPMMWLRIEPERVTGADFAADGDQLLFRYVIGARLTVVSGQRPAPLLPRPMPDLPRSAAAPQAQAKNTTELRLPVTVAFEPMLQAMRAAFPANEILKSTPSPEFDPLSTKVRQVSMFPSRGQLGIELQLDIVEPARWAGLIGTAHFVAKPAIQNDGLLVLETVHLPDHATRPNSAARPAVKTSRPMNAPHVGAEPYAARIAGAARMSVATALHDALPSANNMIDRSLGDGFSLGGHFDDVKVVNIEAVRDGFELMFQLSGTLMLRYGPEHAMAAPAQPAPAATR